MNRVRLSVRSYTQTLQAHRHPYCQLVFPLSGKIAISVSGQEGAVGPGGCVIIGADQTHSFKADEQAHFLVVDLDYLPDNAAQTDTPFVSISDALFSFCQYIDRQLHSAMDDTLEKTIGDLFFKLLSDEYFQSKIDKRIQRVLVFLDENLDRTPGLEELAGVACLSVSQYKALFKSVIGQSTGQYLLKCRMEKALMLLSHTDYPIAVIGATVGYADPSTFSRRFKNYFGQSPRNYRAQ